jgi:hypothetical protein
MNPGSKSHQFIGGKMQHRMLRAEYKTNICSAPYQTANKAYVHVQSLHYSKCWPFMRDLCTHDVHTKIEEVKSPYTICTSWFCNPHQCGSLATTACCTNGAPGKWQWALCFHTSTDCHLDLLKGGKYGIFLLLYNFLQPNKAACKGFFYHL